MKAVITLVFIYHNIAIILSSVGDKSVIYKECLYDCLQETCSDAIGVSFKNKQLNNQQDVWCKLLRWNCKEECSYHCMWHTVRSFKEVGKEIPKFHGKWPFIRVMGIQEPASVVASMLNFAANFYMYRKMRIKFPLLKSHSSPIIIFWYAFAMVCMNTWIWSTIFHMRDTPFTEFMDYACALSMVMGLFFASIVRLCYRRPKLMSLLLLLPLLYFLTHVRYLYSGAINYNYNMKVNIFFGTLGSGIWVLISYCQYADRRHYAWRMLAFTALSGAALALELGDFAPVYHTWDAHALWHLATAPLPLLFYKYVIDDLTYLQSKGFEKSAFKLT